MYKESKYNENKIEEGDQEDISRRSFLKGAAIGLFGSLIAGKTETAINLLEKTAGSQEEKEQGPKINFDIFFSAHNTVKDLEKLPDKIKDVDVYIPEFVGWEENDLKAFNAISSGAMKPEEYLEKNEINPSGQSGQKLLQELEALYGSKKLVAFVDLPAESPIKKLYEEQQQQPSAARTFEERIEEDKARYRKISEIIKLREQFILEQIQKLKRDIKSGAYPDLLEKKEVTIGLLLGAAHTPIYHSLKEKGETAMRSFSNNPFFFSHPYMEISRRYTFNKEVNDELVARGILSDILAKLPKYNMESYADTNLFSRFIRSVVNRFNYKEIKALYEELRSPDSFGMSEEIVRFKLREKGIKLPESEKELEDIFKKSNN